MAVRFPFSDLSSSKLRPAIVLADAGRGDYILCAITSKVYADPHPVVLDASDFAVGGLRVRSYARPGKLFTASTTLFAKIEGQLTADALKQVIDAVVEILQPKPPA